MPPALDNFTEAIAPYYAWKENNPLRDMRNKPSEQRKQVGVEKTREMLSRLQALVPLNRDSKSPPTLSSLPPLWSAFKPFESTTDLDTPAIPRSEYKSGLKVPVLQSWCPQMYLGTFQKETKESLATALRTKVDDEEDDETLLDEEETAAATLLGLTTVPTAPLPPPPAKTYLDVVAAPVPASASASRSRPLAPKTQVGLKEGGVKKPIIKQGGSGRDTAVFRKKHSGGVPALAPHTHQPVSTTRERELFAELMPQYGGFTTRPKFKGMTAEWNQRFVLQTLPGSPGQPLTAVQNDTMIWSKTHKHLRKFFEEWRQSLRDQQNAQFNAQIQKSPLPPTANLNLDMQATISTFFSRPTPAAATSAPSPGEAQDASSL